MSKLFVKLTSPQKNDFPETSDIGLESLGNFLRDWNDGESILSVMNALYNNDIISLGSNMTTIRKDGNDVTIHADYYDTEMWTKETIPYLRMHRDEFARILGAWREFVINNGQEFIVTIENGTIDITTKIDRTSLIPYTLVAKDQNLHSFAKIYLRNDTYRAESNDIPLLNLANFISSRNTKDVILSAIEFAYTNKFDLMFGKNTRVRRDNDYICIRTRHYDTTVYPNDTIPYLRIHRDEFARVLREWLDFIEKNGKEFTITQEDDSTLVVTKTY